MHDSFNLGRPSPHVASCSHQTSLPPLAGCNALSGLASFFSAPTQAANCIFVFIGAEICNGNGGARLSLFPLRIWPKDVKIFFLVHVVEREYREEGEAGLKLSLRVSVRGGEGHEVWYDGRVSAASDLAVKIPRAFFVEIGVLGGVYGVLVMAGAACVDAWSATAPCVRTMRAVMPARESRKT